MRDSRAMESARRWFFLPEWTLVSSRGAVAMAFVATLGATLLAVLTRNLLAHQPAYDELLHVLAARGLLATGAPVIGDGIYERALLYTHAVALSIRYFGDTLVAARMPALLSALVLVAVTGAWVVRRAGFIAGCTAAVVLAINPWTLELAVFSRFYTLHALAVTIIFISLYEAFARDRRPQVRGVFIVLGAMMTGIAWHLQITTVIVLGAAAVGVLAVLALDHGRVLAGFARERTVLVVTAVLILALFAGWAITELGLVERLGSAPLWAENRANAREYYNAALSRDLPLLWPLLPFAFIAALFVDKRLAVFCAIATLAALFVHSVAAQKAPRYIYYVVPLMSVLWGLGAAKAVDLMSLVISRVGPRTASLSGAIALGMIAVTVVNSTEGRRAARLLAGRVGPEVLSYTGEADWSKARPALDEARAKAPTLVASNSMKAMYYLGNYDVEVDASTVRETDTGEDFGIDPRTGRRVISTPASMQQLLSSSGSTLVVVEREKLGNPVGVSTEVVKVLDTRCGRVDLPEAGGVVAWSCEPHVADTTECELCTPTARASSESNTRPTP